MNRIGIHLEVGVDAEAVGREVGGGEFAEEGRGVGLDELEELNQVAVQVGQNPGLVRAGQSDVHTFHQGVPGGPPLVSGGDEVRDVQGHLPGSGKLQGKAQG